MTALSTLTSPVPDWSGWGRGRPRTAREVLAEVASRPAFLLDGLVHATATLLTGPPKSGKTFLVVEWIEALTAGQEWHGRQVGAPTRVLVLPTDPDGFGEYAGRLCPDVLDEVELAHPPKPGDLDGWGRLALYALDSGVGLVVLDTLYGYNPTANINDNGEVGVTLAGLGELARAGVPYLTVHHPPKGGHSGYAGTTSIEAHHRHLVYMDKAGRVTVRGNSTTGSSLQLVRGPAGRTVGATTAEASTSSASRGEKVRKATAREWARGQQVAQTIALLAELPEGLSEREKARRLIGVVGGIDSEGKARTLLAAAMKRLAQGPDGQTRLDEVNASTTG